MKHRRLGCIKDRHDERDLHLSLTVAHLPPSADLRDKFPPIQDQGELGSCTANASLAILRFIDMQEGHDPGEPFSRLFTYYNSRQMEGTIADDAGAQLRDVIKSLAMVGACPESAWPYDIQQFTVQPPISCYTCATTWEALQYQRVPQNVNAMKHCVASGLPFVVGIQVFDSFMSDDVATSGVVPMPGDHETCQGGHAVCCVGYDGDGHFIMRNSWGTAWGKDGYFLLPESYLADTRLSCDMWAISRTKTN